MTARARMAGADIVDIKEALHHSDVSMTMRYSHVTPDSHRTAFDAVAELFSPAVDKAVANGNKRAHKDGRAATDPLETENGTLHRPFRRS